MKTNPLSWSLTFAAMLAFTVSAVAQHGGAGGGGQRERAPALRVRPRVVVLKMPDAQAVLARPE